MSLRPTVYKATFDYLEVHNVLCNVYNFILRQRVYSFCQIRKLSFVTESKNASISIENHITYCITCIFGCALSSTVFIAVNSASSHDCFDIFSGKPFARVRRRPLTFSSGSGIKKIANSLSQINNKA